MTNKARGEAVLNIGGETFTLVCSLKAMAAIETELGASFPDIAQGMGNGVSVKTLLACAVSFARAGGAADVSAIEDSADIKALAGAVGECVSLAFASDKPAKN